MEEELRSFCSVSRNSFEFRIFIQDCEEKFFILVAPVERSLRQKVRHKSRVEVKERYKRMRRGIRGIGILLRGLSGMLRM